MSSWKVMSVLSCFYDQGLGRHLLSNPFHPSFSTVNISPLYRSIKVVFGRMCVFLFFSPLDVHRYKREYVSPTPLPCLLSTTISPPYTCLLVYIHPIYLLYSFLPFPFSSSSSS
ncbi:hypothetical protein AUEXF2481DRAFT_530658 [Aureobasidium subglaciale EXF-2481]|uniref:Uncharacterized protein n=1 Tax=Aureobasidium subglaciale (strain EXF-2481) TaxID=1043005 RepID=A0A074XYW2_AURSE|nr:uncharacterized protein AUEXF2481DRAFT_530658 [Aureobasidium subglaciale EXF-2481]KEQ90738.1 hypothetical protein AUEXF2481DRAFT_530658 [Aureobasidium subglaciale EXF-2481]